jgi:hypothetical protein
MLHDFGFSGWHFFINIFFVSFRVFRGQLNHYQINYPALSFPLEISRKKRCHNENGGKMNCWMQQKAFGPPGVY